MAVTDHYDFWYIDPDEEISDFPSTWNFNIDDIDAAIHEAATNNVAVSRVPKLPASQIDSGKFAQARIPNLPASQTTTGTFDDARIPNSIARTADVDDETAALKKRIDELENANRDSGPRDVSYILDAPESGEAYVIRSGNVVQLSLIDIKYSEPASGGITEVGTLPYGFRPMFTMRGLLSTTSPDSDKYVPRYSMIDTGRFWTNNPGKGLYGDIFFITNNDWPSTMPGDPA